MTFVIPDEIPKPMQTQGSLRIAFISTLSTPFIQDDLEMLKKYCRTQVQIGSGILHIFKIILSCFKSDIAFCWFASTYASVVVAFMHLLGRHSVLVLGGVDVAKDEKLRYGIWLVPWKARLVQYAIRHASKIIAVDDSLAEKARQLAGYDGENIEVVPTGYDIHFWRISGIRKTQSVLTIATAEDEKRLRVKGIDVLLEAARLLPDTPFTIIGLSKKIVLGLNVPMNAEVLPSMDRKFLLPYYQRAKVYCQPSRHEGLSNVLCEAMLCGCIPVATNVGATRSVLGEEGILVPSGDVSALISALQQALQLSEEKRYKAREQIVHRFTQTQREQKLIEILRRVSA
jgi:glycosyltransferase involved in cell wall biosynthesis